MFRDLWNFAQFYADCYSVSPIRTFSYLVAGVIVVFAFPTLISAAPAPALSMKSVFFVYIRNMFSNIVKVLGRIAWRRETNSCRLAASAPISCSLAAFAPISLNDHSTTDGEVNNLFQIGSTLYSEVKSFVVERIFSEYSIILLVILVLSMVAIAIGLAISKWEPISDPETNGDIPIHHPGPLPPIFPPRPDGPYSGPPRPIINPPVPRPKGPSQGEPPFGDPGLPRPKFIRWIFRLFVIILMGVSIYYLPSLFYLMCNNPFEFKIPLVNLTLLKGVFV